MVQNKEQTSHYIPTAIFILLLFFLPACQEKFDITPITDWKQLNDFPGTARASATSFVYQDKAFICLGRSGSKGNFLKDLWEYDSLTDSWTKKADFPGAARVKAIGGVVGDKAYVGLGAVAPYAGNQFNDFWEYNIANNSWKQVASFPGKAVNDLLCVVIDNCLYTTEGYTDTQFKPDTYKYDPQANTWTRLNDCPVKRTGTAGFAIGKNLYVGTGYDIENYKDFYCYNSETDNWKRVANLPGVRVLSKGVTINNYGYMLLGRYWNGSLNGGRLLSDVLRYDPSNDEWTKCGDFPGGGRQNMVVFSINDKGYVVGGEDDYERKADVWVFQP
jgi:N-acetylneuraminic acid mutarotase